MKAFVLIILISSPLVYFSNVYSGKCLSVTEIQQNKILARLVKQLDVIFKNQPSALASSAGDVILANGISDNFKAPVALRAKDSLLLLYAVRSLPRPPQTQTRGLWTQFVRRPKSVWDGMSRPLFKTLKKSWNHFHKNHELRADVELYLTAYREGKEVISPDGYVFPAAKEVQVVEENHDRYFQTERQPSELEYLYFKPSDSLTEKYLNNLLGKKVAIQSYFFPNKVLEGSVTQVFNSVESGYWPVAFQLQTALGKVIVFTYSLMTINGIEPFLTLQIKRSEREKSLADLKKEVKHDVVEVITRNQLELSLKNNESVVSLFEVLKNSPKVSFITYQGFNQLLSGRVIGREGHFIYLYVLKKSSFTKGYQEGIVTIDLKKVQEILLF